MKTEIIWYNKKNIQMGFASMSKEEMTKIYEEFYPKVFAYIRLKIKRLEDAEDLASDVFVKICDHSDRFDARKSSLSTWIFTITRNTVYDYFRTQHPALEIEDNLPDHDDFIEELCRQETLAELAEALKQLPERERDLLLLYFYRGRSLKQIADQMSLSIPYIKELKKKALKQLKEIMMNK